jgi:hypothetical protein
LLRISSLDLRQSRIAYRLPVGGWLYAGAADGQVQMRSWLRRPICQ